MNIVIKRNYIYLIIILIVLSIIISTGVEIVKLKINLSTTKNSNSNSTNGSSGDSYSSNDSNNSNEINENLNVWPLPHHFQIGNNSIRISNNFKIQSNLVTSTIHNKTISKYYNLIFTQDNLINQDISTLNILQIQVYSNDESLNFGFNESYTLTIPDGSSDSGGNGNIAYLKSHNIYGVMRGLETFYQLVLYNFTDCSYFISQCPIEIIDKPRFPHRGFLIDTSRHFIPMEFMYRIIDSMSYNKLNTFHWHVIDSQSFPLTSKTFPNLTMGAWSSQEIYSHKNIESIIQYSKENGIRVELEIDMPGHAKSWGVAFPQVTPENIEITNGCPWNCTTYCNVPLDPSSETSYEIAYGLLEEFTNKSIFPDDFFHIGGDEVSYACWNNSGRITQWMETQKLQDLEQVARYFESKMINKLIELGKKPVMWEDTYLLFQNQSSSQQLPKDVIIQIYHNPLLAINITNDGYYTIQSPARHWYLEYSYSNWISAYSFEPTVNISSSNLHLILGGEGCIWTETIDPSNLFPKMYPSLSAVAERLWSPQYVVDIDAAEIRLNKFRCSLLKRSIGSAPISSLKPSGPFSCYSS